MVAKGKISVRPNLRVRIVVAAHLIWLVTLCLLGAWWGRLVLSQAARIADLETRLGISASAAHEHWARTQRMLAGESIVFFALLVLATSILLWLYLREAERTRSLQAFFASVTHELRTPLTSIRLQAESIADSVPENATERPLVERLLEDTSRLESQVERTLELARVEGGGTVLNQPFRVKPWLEYFLQTWTNGFGGRVEVTTQVEECLIQADPSAFQMILKNLIDNSIKHAGHRGKVQIRLESPQIENDWVVLRYSDNGSGFKGDSRKLGSLFYKGEMSQGAGVGLYLVESLMRRMGGRAEFAAHPQLETKLWFKRGTDHG